MLRITYPLALGGCLLFTGCSSTIPLTTTDARQQVFDTERAFAKTMADRELEAFASFIAKDAIFFSENTPLRGKQRVVDAWSKLYASPIPPFSWEPRDVEVLGSGDLALSSGPVHDATGKEIATFTSIWRREAPNTWRIVFDKGNDVCRCGKQ